MKFEDFTASLKQLSKRIETSKDSIQTEEATKMSFIIPLFQILGYDVFNPTEFVPEFTADVGIKKGEKVDYAILINNTPTILIEAKWCGEPLEKHDSQLFRYFAVSNAKFAILTNGLIYRFFTDLDEQNKMDEKPFLEINMLDLKESQLHELRKFCKENFDLSTIFNSASELKYTNSIKLKLGEEFNNPSDQFVKLLINDVYDGVKTQKVVDDFKVIVKKSFTQYINELISDRLKSALDAEREPEHKATGKMDDAVKVDVDSDKINTTDDEMQAYYIVKSMLVDVLPLDSINYKDTESYFGILFENNIRKWICRVKLGDKVKKIILPSSDNKTISISFDKIEDLFLHRQAIIESADRFSK